MPRTERIRYIHNFTPEERVGLYGSLSDSLTAHETAEEEKSSVVSDFNSKIKMLEADIHATNRKLRDGYEERETEAGVTRDAKRGKVFYHDLMTGELLLERDMTGADYQFTLDDDLPSDDE